MVDNLVNRLCAFWTESLGNISRQKYEDLLKKKGLFMNSNKTVRGIVALAMCVALTVSASAAYAHQAVGSLGTGYANVKSSTSASAWTTANSKGSSPEDYVSVDFSAYTFGSTVWGPDGGKVTNEGANYVEAYGSNDDAANIKYVDSEHSIKRGDVESSTTIYNTKAG